MQQRAAAKFAHASELVQVATSKPNELGDVDQSETAISAMPFSEVKFAAEDGDMDAMSQHSVTSSVASAQMGSKLPKRAKNAFMFFSTDEKPKFVLASRIISSN